VFAELQQAGMYAAAPDGDVMLAPGYRGTLQTGPDAPVTTVAVNALGLRGPEPGPRQAGERRVLCVGDSVVFGYGLDADAAFPDRLAAQLGDRLQVPFVAGNGGVPGFGSTHAASHLGHLLPKFAPDAVVFAYTLANDPVDDLRPQRTVEAGLLFQGAMARLMRSSWRARLALRSRFAFWLEATIWDHKPEWSPLRQLQPDAVDEERLAGLPGSWPEYAGTAAGLFLDAIDPATTWQPGAPPPLPRVFAELRDSLRRVRAHAGPRPLVLIVLPTTWHLTPAAHARRLRDLGHDPAQFRFGIAQERVLQVAAEVGVAAIDATPELARQADPASLFLDGGHLSRRGSEVVAGLLADALAPALK
jgi:lysophospholipase L1-like esterase